MLTKYMRLLTQVGTDPLKDVSLDNQNGAGIVCNFDKLYIGQHYPFVNLFMLMDVINDANSKILIDYWDGVEWINAVDILDSTNALKSTGMVQFSLQNKYSWNQVHETDSDSPSCPDGFAGLFINECYWLRVSFDPLATTPNPLTKIKKICYAFTTTDVVNSIDVEGSSFYDAILEGKTNWVNEIITASEMMVSDLKRVGFIKSAGQIIEFDEIYLACAYKTLMHIYFQLGKAYATQMAIMSSKYEKALSSKALTFDNDQDGKISIREIASTETRMVR